MSAIKYFYHLKNTPIFQMLIEIVILLVLSFMPSFHMYMLNDEKH